MTNYNAPNDPLPVGPVRGGGEIFSAFSLLAVIAALLALFNILGTGLSFFLAIAAIGFGVLGMLVALSPTKRGGIISFFAVGAGLLAIVVALFRLLGHAANSL